MPGRKLKVFQARFGFYDTVVAAPSQTAALRAWGIHQNLFASGDATATADEAAIAAAIAHPETPLRRPVGSTDAFVLEPTGAPKVPDEPKKAVKPAHTPKPAARAKPPADRSELNSAEKALRTIDEERKCEEADLRREEEELQARRQFAQSTYVEARKVAAAKVVEAQSAYVKAGGEA